MDGLYSKYLGKVCPYCKTEFIEGDEIVVCSDCEMPHHKECFIENKGCTTFGCQGSMKSLIITSTPVVDVQMIENDVRVKMASISTPISTQEQEAAYKERIQESIYEEILSKLTLINDFSNNINDLIIVRKLIDELEKIRNYKDVAKHIELANQKIINISSYLLNTTKVQLSCTDKVSLLKVGLRRYEKIGNLTGIDVNDYKKTAFDRIAIIERENAIKERETEIKELNKAKEAEKERIDNEIKKRNRIKYFVAGLLITALLIVAYIFINKYFQLTEMYNAGLSYVNEEKYKEAKLEFEKCGNFSSSKYYVEYCEKMIHYTIGKKLVDEGKIEEALKEFELSGDVEEVLEFIEYCKDKLKELGEEK